MGNGRKYLRLRYIAVWNLKASSRTVLPSRNIRAAGLLHTDLTTRPDALGKDEVEMVNCSAIP
jgi:hypothetical protein